MDYSTFKTPKTERNDWFINPQVYDLGFTTCNLWRLSREGRKSREEEDDKEDKEDQTWKPEHINF